MQTIELNELQTEDFTPEHVTGALRVISKMYESGEYVKDILSKLKIPKSRFFKMVETIPMLGDEYARAQRARAELIAEEVVEIADDEIDAARGRNRIMARQWYAAKMKPQKFGERIDLNITQVVDIGAALNDAKGRIKTVQADVITKEITQRVTGTEPVEQESIKLVDTDDMDILT